MREQAHEKATQEQRNGTPGKLTGIGKLAGIIPSSEEFMRQK
jgi:hypothetical protein